ncbi:MAG: DHH family phosphoesterase [Thermoplasmata archaeon]
MNINISELKKIFQKEKKALVMHKQADVDSLACAIAIYLTFPYCRIITPSSANTTAKRVAEHYSIDIGIDEKIDPEERIILLDSSSDNQLGDLLPTISNKMNESIVIDHHSKNPKWNPKFYISDEKRNSCAEVIFNLFEKMDVHIDEKVAEVLLLGIITDTAHFRFANADTFRIFASLLEKSKKNMDNILSILEVEEEDDYSKKIANLKGAQRLSFRTYKKFIVALSQVSSFEASVSKSLLLLGADVSFVGAQNDLAIRISARANTDLTEKGLHLGNLLREIGEETGNLGGGHAGAAGLNGTGDVESILNICAEKTIEILKKLFP